MPHALIVDDDASTREALNELVTAEGFSTAAAGDLREARIQLTRLRPDVVLVDLKLPDGDGMELLADLGAGAEIVVMTGFASVDSAVEAMRLGAADYLVKPVNLQRVKAVLARVPRTGDLKAEIGLLRGQLRQLGRFGPMLGGSPAMQTLYDRLSRVAPTEATVLLTGESGTGKELAASTVHGLSRRRREVFLAVNCGAISPSLIESEMFGHEKGSFTGADRQHRGYFERANGGTLFLDEISEMPPELQVKLLRVLETGAFMRIGTHAEIQTDVRLIAATNRDPMQAVAEKRLRADLFHRLNVFPIDLPPLRERGADVQQLAQAFLDELNAARGTHKRFAPDTLGRLQEHAWPGNVRELRNYVERAYIMADDVLETPVAAPIAPEPDAGAVTVAVGTSLADADRKLIMATLQRCGGVKKRAADVLGISLKTLYNRLEEYRAEDEAQSAADQGSERPGMAEVDDASPPLVSAVPGPRHH